MGESEIAYKPIANMTDPQQKALRAFVESMKETYPSLGIKDLRSFVNVLKGQSWTWGNILAITCRGTAE
jgi:hypothetical protein